MFEWSGNPVARDTMTVTTESFVDPLQFTTLATLDYFDIYDNVTDFPGGIIHRPTKPLWFTIIIVMTIILGLLTNGTLIYLVASVRELRTSPNVLLANLALGDFIFIFITAPPVISPSYLTTSFGYCRINHFIYFTSFSVSSMSLTAISIERYFAIVKPFLVRRLRIMRATIIICLIVWVIACSIASYVFPAAVVTPGLSTTCTFEYEKKPYKVYYLIQLILFYIIPVLSMAFFYGLCARKLLWEKTILHRDRRRTTRSADDKARLRVSVNLFIITFVFTVCWLPNYIYSAWLILAFNFKAFSSPHWENLGRIRIVMYYMASCINPIILYSMSSSFRQHLARKFGLHRARRSFRNASESSGRTRSSVIIRTPSLRSIPHLAVPLCENHASHQNDSHYVRTASDSV